MMVVPSGGIAAAVLNAPSRCLFVSHAYKKYKGCMHYSQISECRGLYEKLERFYEKTGGTIVVDSAFDKGRNPFLVKYAQEKTHSETPEDLNSIRQATSLRQNAEWGMCMFQGSFLRMKYRFTYEERG